MKIAKLPTGKLLKFPDETPDEAVDHVVRTHIDRHIQEKKAAEDKIQHEKDEHLGRHQQITDMLALIAQLLHNLTEHTINGQHIASNNHKEAGDAFMCLLSEISKPKKRRLVRDEKGKAIGAEDYD
jgi:hypothetical protein